MTEAPSVTTFVMGERLPWPDDAPGLDDNGPFDAAVAHEPGRRRQCSIRKISALGATLRGTFERTAGDGVAIKLPTGQRAAGTIAWASGGEAGVRFSQPVDVVALINRELVSQPVERRAMPRVEIRCSAFIKKGGDYLPVVIRNISARGLQLEGDTLPPVDTYVAVFVEGLNIPAGEVAWRKGNLAGVELLEELSWTSIMPWLRELMRKRAH